MDAARLAARLRELTGFDEHWIADQQRQRNAVAASHALLSRCLGDTAGSAPADLDAVRALTLADRDWLLLEMRERSLGSRIVAEVRCVSCGSAAEVRFSTRDVAIDRGPAGDVTHRLPSGRTAVLKPIAAGDHEAFAGLAEADPERQRTIALGQAVRSIDGVDAAVAADDLSEEDRASLIEAIESLLPEGLRLDITCVGCGRALAAAFDVPAFVVSELREHGRTLLDDVHALASVYHWTEPDIFALPLRRRLAYLARLDADTSRALLRGDDGR